MRQTNQRTLWWLITSIIMFNSPKLDSQSNFDESWRWVHFTAESGLPSNNVFSVVETPDSTLWAVCDAGVAWYDGYQWHPVQLPSPHLTEGKIPPCDYRGDSILVGLENGEWYAVEKYGFSKLPVPLHSILTYFSGDSIFVLKDELPYLFIRDFSQSFVRLQEQMNRTILSFQRTKWGRVWITTSEGAYRWEDNNWQLIFKFDGLSPASSFRIDENSNGVVFAWFELPLKLRGMWQYLPSLKKAYRVTGDAGDVRGVAISSSQMLVAAYYFGEVKVRSGASWNSSSVLEEKCKGLHNLFFRRNGDLVIAASDGIHYYRGSSSRWSLLPSSKPEMGAINEILTTHSGDIWVGTANGIIIYGKKGESKIVTHIDGAPMVAITGLGEDRNGNIWVSSGGSFDGAYRWDGSSWKHFKISDNRDGARFHKIRADHDGKLWFLGLSKLFEHPTVREPGIFIYDGIKFTRWECGNGISNQRVYAFDEDVQGSLWFGTNVGISRWKNGTWQHWTTDRGLRKARVFTLAIDRERNVWFGHQISGLGLGCIDSTGAIKYFTTSDGLVNDYVWEVRIDTVGVLWIATRGGLGSYSNGMWSRFDESSGLQSSLLWPVLPLKDKVYVGTHGKGVAILNRRESFAPAPRIVIDEPNINRQDVHIRWRAYAYWGAIAPSEILTQYRINNGRWSDWSKVHELDLKNAPPGEHTISVQARGLFGNYSQEIQHATFTVLPLLFLRPVVLFPGVVLVLGLVVLGFVFVIRKRRYNIELRHREAKFRAVTELTPSAIFIYDQSHIHFMNLSAETLTGYSLLETAAMSITDLIYPEDMDKFSKHFVQENVAAKQKIRSEIRIVTRSGGTRWLDFTSGPMSYQGEEMWLGTALEITERKIAEEKLRSLTTELISTEERERRRFAIYLHDVIGQALALCKIKLRAVQKSGSFASEDANIQEILRLVDDSIKDTRSLTFDLSPPVLYELNFPVALRSLIEQLLDQHSIGLNFIYDGSPITLKDETKVIAYHVVREIIMNCIKHARASQVKLDLSVLNNSMLITITDDGIGFKTEVETTDQISKQGFGLFNIRQRLLHLGGSLKIQPSEGHGTSVIISIPMSVMEVHKH